LEPSTCERCSLNENTRLEQIMAGETIACSPG
jgi:hypothetical protein